ncbi:MAG: peptidase M23 [Candidatus Rokuibacteriota bacterium]|nr:MAG: peptidase M23 [Candidatus Rokubacteria bacterium]
MTRGRRPAAAALLALLLALPLAAPAADRIAVTWHPKRPHPGDVAWIHVRGISEAAALEGSLGSRTLVFFPYAGGQTAVVGIDVETKPGHQPWRLAILEPGQQARALDGRLTIHKREFAVQRLTLPPPMVDLDPETERRAVSESERLATLYRTVTPERLWRGAFVRPVAGHEAPTGFGARRVINGKPRAPHSGADYAAPKGTAVVAANTGRVALVGDFFFPGRLVVLDHGHAVYTLYFHLDTVAVGEGEVVDRGHIVGTVGATGRATGPHLHFGALVGGARIDPVALMSLNLKE